MHIALYRKWRPANFSQVSGQNHITSILQYQVREQKVCHAYLFSGTRGTGKTSCAKILAKAVNCLNPTPNGDPCGECEACRSIDNGTATDVLEMDAASNTGVDYIRDIKEAVIYTPSSLKYRVYIIDEVHMLSTSAFNALLKTLEEPPEHVIFILATTEQQKIPVTILSRCQRFEFRRIGIDDIKNRLLKIADAENIKIDEKAATFIAKLSSGGMRDAVSLLELCAGKGEKITAQTVSEIAGAASREGLEKLILAVRHADYETVFEEIKQRYNSAQDLSVLFSELLGYYRDILVTKRTRNPREYTELDGADFARLEAIAEEYPAELVAYHSRVLEDAYIRMQRGGADKRLIAEISLIKLSDAKLDTSNEAILTRLCALESGVVETKPQKTVRFSDTEKAEPVNTLKSENAVTGKVEEMPKKNDTQNNPKKNVKLKYWAEVVQKISVLDIGASSFLARAKAYFDEESGIVTVGVENSLAKNIIDREPLKTNLAEILKQYNQSFNGMEIKVFDKSETTDYLDEIE